MSPLKYIKPDKHTRMSITLGCLVLNYLIVMFGIFQGSDLSDLGTGLALLNAPLYVYVIGQSIRPSNIEGVIPTPIQ